MPKVNQILPAIGAKSTAPTVIHVKQGQLEAQEEQTKSCKIEDIVEEVIHESDKANALHIWALGVVCVVGGQCYGWNAAFETGFIPYVVSQVIMGMAFVVYISSAAEVSGKIAFSGGSYGLARISLGFYPGFIVGFLELLEYIASAAVSVTYVGAFVSGYFGWDQWTEPVIWFFFHGIFISIFQLRGKYIWNFMVFFACTIVGPVILFIFASLSYTDLPKNALFFDNDTSTTFWARGTLSSAYFAWLPYTTWAYAGVECLTLVTSMTKEPKRTIPRGMVSATWTLFIMNVSLVFIVPSLPPGIETIIDDVFPLNNGYGMGVGISDVLGQWLILPAQMGMAAGFFIPYTKLTQALANSNLIPPILGLKNQASTLKPMIASSIFGYLICLVGFFSEAFQQSEQNIFILAGTVCYAAQLVGFIMLRTTYKTETTGYTSPYGIPGAIFSCVVYGLLALSIVGGFQGDGGVAGISLLAFLSILTIYYYTVVKKVQTLSKDEYASVFRFSIVKYNNIRIRNAKKAKKAAAAKRAAANPTESTAPKSWLHLGRWIRFNSVSSSSENSTTNTSGKMFLQ
ncbi:Amino Acid-Polyamine-Organocation (APC) Family [Thraustotheca clavata]|uniref:Amino Acid-Polyamine-Organocation (APC) Family n=1 Tax=Thraustotheca clavata TaxID=74557 RepID=A0A1W0A1Y5_9STRA|nr:Amino Acid-Polyamine-Organocation (APC) Family [Thraustotheca clavata]